MATVAWKKDASAAIDAGGKWVQDGFPILYDADRIWFDGSMWKRYGQVMLVCTKRYDGFWCFYVHSPTAKSFTKKQQEFLDLNLPVYICSGSW